MPDPVTDSSRYTAIARGLAGRALGMAVDASAYRPREGETRASMLIARAAAMVLLGDRGEAGAAEADRSMADLAQQVADAAGESARMPKVVDGAGHARDVYYPLVLHLMFSAWALDPAAVESREHNEHIAALLLPIAEDLSRDQGETWDTPAASERLGAALWRAVVALEAALLIRDTDAGLAALGVIRRIADTPGRDGALHAQAADDTPDAWVYRELTGLHALHLVAQLTRDVGWAARCGQVAQYHLGHTQPDYTTYQPWGLAAFAEGEQTAVFAEQQLHDVQTHLAIEGPGGALLPGLLLADASASMDGTIVRAWRRFRFQG